MKSIIQITGVILLTLVTYLCTSKEPLSAKTLSISNGIIQVQPVKSGNQYTGFNVMSSGKTAAVIRFSSNKIITASKCTISTNGRTMSFGGLMPKSGLGLSLGNNDNINIQLFANDPYPKISFDINIKTFDSNKWQQKVGKQPFHFLAIYMPDAEVWHQHGWLNETPVADPFPLLIDPHGGTPELSAYHYNRNWSNTIPLGGHPVPMIGLWAPKSKHYAGFEFQSTRLANNSEKDIATGYCWGDGKAPIRKPNPSQFASLVYPHGGIGYQKLVLPSAGTRIKSSCVLLWSLNMPATDDPNALFYSYVWNRYRGRLSQIQPMVDLSWLPEDVKMRNFAWINRDGRIIRGPELPFETPDTKVIAAWENFIEDEVTSARIAGKPDAIRGAEEDCESLLKNAKRFTIDGDKCVCWEKPLQGRWTDEWGGDAVKTVHNSDSFGAGRLLLSMYKHSAKTEYLEAVDGVLNWAKHIGWTRNEFADVPSSPFAIGSVLSISFLLDYYMTFKDAPDQQHRDMAKTAIEMVRPFMCRYISMWLCDNNRSDNLDSAFLWEPNSGRDWTGAACSNEVALVLNVLGAAAVHTGDPFLMWALQGSLDRFHVLYQEAYKDSLADYRGSDFTEVYALYDGCALEPGRRARFGLFYNLNMLEPIGSSTIRVLAGEKAAMAFNKDGIHSNIREYRYTPDGNLTFTLVSSNQSTDLSLTVPFVDISTKPVKIIREGQTVTLEPGVDVTRVPEAFWSLLIKGLHSGDQVIVGDPDINDSPLPDISNVIKEQNSKTTSPDPAFSFIRIPFDTKPDTIWTNPDSWFGIPTGLMWAYDIPFMISNIGGMCTLTKPAVLQKPINDSTMIAVLYSANEHGTPSVTFSDGTTGYIDSRLESLAWRAWPAIRTAKLLVSVVDISGKTVTAINPNQSTIWAVTSIKNTKEAPYRVINSLTQAASQWKEIQSDEKKIAVLKNEVDKIQPGRIAILPPKASGVFMDIMSRTGLTRKSVTLTPEQLVDPSFFNADRFPVAVYAAGEEYTHTVHVEGDGAIAVQRYVNEGGTLLIVSTGANFPFYYALGPSFRRGEPFAEQIGIPIDATFESSIPEKLRFELCEDQNILDSVPKTIAYSTMDIRMRGIGTSRLQEGTIYTPIYKVVGASGKVYTDAAGLIDLPDPKGEILFIFGSIFSDPDYGQTVARATLMYLIEKALQ